MTRQLTQFEPARAKRKLEVDQLGEAEKLRLWWEQKIDGEREKLHVGEEGELNRIDSRRQSVNPPFEFVEKSDRVPHIGELKGLPRTSMFDSEAVSVQDERLVELPGEYWDALMNRDHPHMQYLERRYKGAIPVYPHVSKTVSVMGSSAERAVRIQQDEDAWIRLYAFDVLQFEGKSPLSSQQVSRRNFLAGVLEKVDPGQGPGGGGHLLLMPAWWGLKTAQVERLFYLLTDWPIEGEGLVGKDPTAAYNAARNWYKLKRHYPVDVVTTGGYKIGEAGKTGKMLGLVSSVAVGVFRDGALWHVGWVSAIMDSEAKLEEITALAATDRLGGLVMTCHHNGVQDDPKSPLGFTLRHPRFNRWRDDKNASDCTVAALLAEIKKEKL